MKHQGLFHQTIYDMEKYTIRLNYDASITVDVLASDEGEALTKARDFAEDADIRQFTICNESTAEIINRIGCD